MKTLFREFMEVYKEFKEKCPNHPLLEELTVKLARRKFPSDDWLTAQIRRMHDLMSPVWRRNSQSSGEN